MTGLSAPTPYTDMIKPIKIKPDAAFPFYQNSHSLPAYNQGTSKAGAMLENLLSDKNKSKVEAGGLTFGWPARLEFFLEESGDKRGVVLFDNDENLIIHALDALLGYSGAGGKLSEWLMEHIGVPRWIVDEVQENTKGAQFYNVIVLRDPAKTPIPGPGLRSDWSWHRIR